MSATGLKRVVVAGAQGMLGHDVSDLLAKSGFEVFSMGRDQLDITDPAGIEEVMSSVAPQWVVNCAAYTKVDECEVNWEHALLVNGKGPGHLARACAGHGATLVHVSTDYVFDGQGTRPYLENDPVSPINAYGRSKLAGEREIKGAGCNFIIVRTAWLFGKKGPNFVDTILRLYKERGKLKVVNDQLGCPTFTRDLAWGILQLMETGASGVVNVVNSGACTWFQFARQAVQLSGLDPSIVEPVGSQEFPRPAKRPAFSVLDTSLFARLTGKQMRPWEEALEEYILGV